MADKNLVTNPDAVKPIDASKIKPDITVEFGNENDVEERYLFDLYQKLKIRLMEELPHKILSILFLHL